MRHGLRVVLTRLNCADALGVMHTLFWVAVAALLAVLLWQWLNPDMENPLHSSDGVVVAVDEFGLLVERERCNTAQEMLPVLTIMSFERVGAEHHQSVAGPFFSTGLSVGCEVVLERYLLPGAIHHGEWRLVGYDSTVIEGTRYSVLWESDPFEVRVNATAE